MKKPIVALGFTVFSFMLPAEALAATFSKMYVFGDSLSDPGNIYNATAAVNSIPIPPGVEVPPVEPSVPPYDEDGRFSNHLVWSDYLAQDLGIDLIPSTELSVFSHGSDILSPIALINGQPQVSPFFNGATATNSVNFAFGAAQTGTQGVGEFGELIPGMLTQVEWFEDDLAVAGQQADDDALYIVWGGPNDYQLVSEPEPEETVGNLAEAVQTLYDLGARNFLVPNLPDLGKTPRALSMGDDISMSLTTLSQIHNTLLNRSLGDLSQLDDMNIVEFDAFSMLNKTIANPEVKGFTNVTNSCIESLKDDGKLDGTQAFEVCDHPDEYLFWDGIHPTTVAHEQLADEALLALESEPQSVPEPVSSAALGFLGLGWLIDKKFKKFQANCSTKEKSN
ncbi:GDSL-like lipase/acylhydrolase, putative [Coleofasciculus chthonoplastes PCC 7420]|uniref:GDSL-like lipase/acylhydrolase, putative n=1 Tax=Coleofasciculus chthonoplastes PCC 7420 TaxID=118168 RepID=B4VS95_9CYAN|nr:SGNH/GDSL hydrolase family protein [Coleofasciculus chthonoplastes]EDX75133.1 GDSL-like lipase/acylhydrolase, putative [Coleofasciculus chthonoplastes PCC 7420]